MVRACQNLRDIAIDIVVFAALRSAAATLLLVRGADLWAHGVGQSGIIQIRAADAELCRLEFFVRRNYRVMFVDR